MIRVITLIQGKVAMRVLILLALLVVFAAPIVSATPAEALGVRIDDNGSP